LPLTKDEYLRYISNYRSYTLPFETTDELQKIANKIAADIFELQHEFGFEVGISGDTFGAVLDDLSGQIVILRELRKKWQEYKLKKEYSQEQKIDEVINALKNIRNLPEKPSIALEKWTTIALNILNDAVAIKPNAPLGDDNEPTFTAPKGVPDVECYYDGFGAICEVTMLTGRDQWYNEGQPVMRHLRSFEQANDSHDNYCLFVAPRLHIDTVNTFWTAVKYEYEGQRQKIVPITITGLIDILGTVRDVKSAQKGFLQR
jgi:hypothetical protein